MLALVVLWKYLVPCCVVLLAFCRLEYRGIEKDLVLPGAARETDGSQRCEVCDMSSLWIIPGMSWMVGYFCSPHGRFQQTQTCYVFDTDS